MIPSIESLGVFRHLHTSHPTYLIDDACSLTLLCMLRSATEVAIVATIPKHLTKYPPHLEAHSHSVPHQTEQLQ